MKKHPKNSCQVFLFLCGLIFLSWQAISGQLKCNDLFIPLNQTNEFLCLYKTNAVTFAKKLKEIREKQDDKTINSGIKGVVSMSAIREMEFLLQCPIAESYVDISSVNFPEKVLGECVTRCVLQAQTIFDAPLLVNAAMILGRIRREIIVGYIEYPYYIQNYSLTKNSDYILQEKIRNKNREIVYQSNLRGEEHLLLNALYMAMANIYARLESESETKQFEELLESIVCNARFTKEEKQLFIQPKRMISFGDEKVRWKVRRATVEESQAFLLSLSK